MVSETQKFMVSLEIIQIEVLCRIMQSQNVFPYQFWREVQLFVSWSGISRQQISIWAMRALCS